MTHLRHEDDEPTDEEPIGANRRRLMLGGATLVAGWTLGTGRAAAADKPERMPPQIGDRLQITKGSLKGEFLRPELLEQDQPQIEGFPFSVTEDLLRKRNRFNRLLFVRIDPNEIDEETAPLAVDGVLVYSAICTHKGCTIKSWLAEERHLRCHCHLSQFDVKTGGSVRDGPARAPLPMLGVKLDDDGFVTVAAEFNRKPGFKG